MTMRPSHSGDSRGVRAAVAATFLLVLLAVPAGIYAQSFANERVETCTVTSTDRTRHTDGGGSDMRVYTAECGTVQVADRYLRGQFSAADLFGQLQPGEQYRMQLVGYRIGLFSMFPTVLDAQPVPGLPEEVTR